MKHRVILIVCLLSLFCVLKVHSESTTVGGTVTLSIGAVSYSHIGVTPAWINETPGVLEFVSNQGYSTMMVKGLNAGTGYVTCNYYTEKYDSNLRMYVIDGSMKTKTFTVNVSSNGGGNNDVNGNISFAIRSYSANVGDNIPLIAECTGDLRSATPTTWASSDPTVAEFVNMQYDNMDSKAIFKAKKVGTTTISATRAGKSATIPVYVSAASNPTSISLNYNSISLTEGNTRQLTATVLPSGASQSVTWSVYSGSSYASVSSSGLITAKAAGIATVRATSAVNSSVYKDCTVTVTAATLEPGTWSGNSLTIGGSATNSVHEVPYGNYYKYSTAQMLYTPTEIGKSGTISSIAFRVASSSSFATSEVKIYLGHKSGKFSSTSSYVTSSNLTLVYSGSPTLGSTTGWETLTFNQGSFTYNGTDNLVVVVTRKSTSYTDLLKYYCYSGNGYTLYRRSDETSNYGDVTTTGNYSTSTNRPAIKMTLASSTPPTSINLNTTSVSLEVGGTKQLTATVLPSGASQSVTWSVISGSSVASVSSSGLVTAKAVGTATVRATSTANSSVYKDCTVTVTTVPTSISLNYTSITLQEGETKQLTATVSPSSASQSVTWSVVSGSIYASVSSSGLVTAKTAGTATVRATSAVNSSVYKDCTVTVTEPVLPPGTWSGNTVTIGDNATSSTSKAPYNNYWTYSTTQMLYSPAEIGKSGTINSIAFKVASASSFTTTALKVYLGHRSSLFSSTTDYMTSSNLTLVYDGTPTLGASSGWETLTFNKGTFDYNGTDNLVVVVAMKSSNYDTTLGYYCYTGSGYVLSRGSDDTTGYGDITNTSYGYSTSTERPSIRLGFGQSQSGTTYNDGDTFTAQTVEGVEMTFKIISAADKTCQVGNNSSAAIATATSGIVTIPQVINGLTVTAIGDRAFSYSSGLTSITIPNSVTSIGYEAFAHSSGLTSITIPNSVTTIGDGAFWRCFGLTSVTISSSVTSIESNAFSYCKSLMSITVDSSNPKYDSRNNCNAIIVTSSNTLLVGCKNTIIPNSVTTIGSYAFCYCLGLTSITIPNSVTSIGREAFYYSGLTSVTSEIEEPFSIYHDVFAGVTATLYVPAGTRAKYQTTEGWNQFTNIVEIEPSVLNDGDTFSATNSDGLTLKYYVISAADKIVSVTSASKTATHISIPAEVNGFRVIEIGSSLAQGNTNLESVVIPEGISRITREAFLDCISLTSLYIPASVTSIKPSSFHGCINLREVVVADDNPVYDSRENCNGIIETATNTLFFGNRNTVIPQSVTAIGSFSATGDVVIPSQITVIGEDAFMFMEGMTSVTIPAGVTAIGKYAFEDCSGLTSVTSLITSPFAIDESVFRNHGHTPSATLYVPVGTKALYETTAGWNLFPSIVELEPTVDDDPQTIEVDGIYYKIAKASDALNGIEQTIYQSDVEVAVVCEAEKGHEYSGDIVIPSSITYDGKTYPVACVAECAFAEYKGWNGKEIRSVVMPNSVVAIGEEAFVESGTLRRVEIPNSVRYIGEDVFGDCESLSEIVSYIQEPFAINNDVFRNIANDATLYVPFGTKALYEAATGWNRIANIVEMEPTEIEVTDISQMDNVIYVEPVEFRPGSETIFSLKMKNTVAIRSFGFDLYLPEGITATPNSSGKPWGSLNYNRVPKDEDGYPIHKMTLSYQEDNTIRFLCDAQEGQTFIGNDGEIATLKVSVSETMADGDYPVILKNVKLSETDIANYYLTEKVISKITILSFILGDINNDGFVDVSDYSGVADRIHGRTPVGFNEKAGDVDENGIIDVSDYSGVANLIHYGSIHGKGSSPSNAKRTNNNVEPQ